MARTKKISSIGVDAHKFSSVAEWVAQQAQQDVQRLIICGSIASGKRTLIERMQREYQQADTKPQDRAGKGADLAMPLNQSDELPQHFFSTPRRRFIIADIAGHEQNTSKLFIAAAAADAALLLIDAQQGIVMQTRRHANLITLAGMRHIILVINKMDLVAYDHQRFDAIVAEFQALAESLGVAGITAIPLSVLKGDNITSGSARMPWYPGPSLMDVLVSFQGNPQTTIKAVFPVQSVIRPNTSFPNTSLQGYQGTLASGAFAVGDEVRVTASGQVAKIERIITADADLQTACAGDAITLVLDRDVDAMRGDVIARADQPLEMTDQFEATLVWLQDEPGLISRTYEIKLATQWASASITALKYRIDVDTQAHASCRQLERNDIAAANLAMSKPLVFDDYAHSRTLGGFMLVDKFSHLIVAVGMIRHNLRRAQNVHRQALSIKREDREQLNGHQGKVIWFTGLSGSGKSTIANALEKELNAQGKHTYILDGDNIRQGLNKDLGFTDADRVENIRRVAEVAKLMMDAGLIVMTAFISPFRAERQMARELIGEKNFIEVYVDTPLTVCEQRDPKGLYKKARSGQLPNMTGINSPYEAPVKPELTINSNQQEMEQALTLILGCL
jgi:bifunctional enzyme CysN/CysC